MSGRPLIPKSFPFRKLTAHLKIYGILWYPRKGKGGHGSFVGKDVNGSVQSYPLPSDQKREVRKSYLKKLSVLLHGLFLSMFSAVSVADVFVTVRRVLLFSVL